MKKRYIFRGISSKSFDNFFKTDEDCYEYLCEIKWNGDAFVCKKCGNTHYCKGHLPFSRRCTKCKYDESPTAETMFNKIKFPILTAFRLIFDMCCMEEGTSSNMLSERYGIRQKTIWGFKRKIHLALSDQRHKPLEGVVLISPINIQPRRSLGQENIVLSAIEILSDEEIGKAYSCYVECASEENIRMFIERHISIAATIYVADNDRLELSAPGYNIQSCEKQSILSLGKDHVSDVKNWLFGIHRHFSQEYIQGYLDEYYYSFNRRRSKNLMFDDIISLMVSNQPVRISM